MCGCARVRVCACMCMCVRMCMRVISFLFVSGVSFLPGCWLPRVCALLVAFGPLCLNAVVKLLLCNLTNAHRANVLPWLHGSCPLHSSWSSVVANVYRVRVENPYLAISHFQHLRQVVRAGKSACVCVCVCVCVCPRHSLRTTGGHRTRLASVSLCPLFLPLLLKYVIRIVSHLSHYPVSAESHSSSQKVCVCVCGV